MTVVSDNLFLAQIKELRSVVVEQVGLLLGAQEIRRLDRLNRHVDRLRPDHLVRAEHDSLAETGAHEAPEMIQECLMLDNPRDGRHVAIELRVLVHHRDHFRRERKPAVLHEQAEVRMSHEHFFQQNGIARSDSKARQARADAERVNMNGCFPSAAFGQIGALV